MESADMQTEDSHQICRLCLSEESLGDVFEEEDIHQMISDYLSITISDKDRLSQSVCEICRIRLTEFHQFRINCQEAQIVQQSMLKDRDSSVEEANLESQTQQQRQDDPNYDLPEIKKSPLYLELRSNDLPVVTTQDFKREILSIVDYREEENGQTLSLENIIGIENVKVEVDTDNDLELSAQSSSDWEQTVQERANVTKNKSHACPTCHKILPCRKTLWYHKKREHEAPKHNCSTCGIGFVFQYHLTQHLLSKQHAERLNPTPVPDDPSKPYKCEICHKGYRDLSRLKSHLKDVHEPKRHICPICDLKFRDKPKLQQHLKNHYRGNGDAFSQLEKLLGPNPKKLLLKHDDGNFILRPFKCDVCPMAFKEIRRLTCHRKRVHGPKTHGCRFCDFKNSCRFNVDRHERTRHDRESVKAICSKGDK